MVRLLATLLWGLAPLPTGAASEFDDRASRIVDSASFKAAVTAFERDFDHFVRDIVRLTEIPAPPFGEGDRAAAYLALMVEAGLERATFDGIGNAIALWRGGGGVPLVAVGAHLDTVFPAGTDVKVKRVGTRLHAPGVGDNARGLAFLLAAVRAMRTAGIQPNTDILFLGSVGEEGAGDLRGMRYFFTEGEWRDRIKRFIVIDGSSNDLITNGALGSVRYRVTFQGPGGDGSGASGQMGPALAMRTVIANLGKLVGPRQPRVSYAVEVVSGGTSVKSIPNEVTLEVDLRATSPEELKDADVEFQGIVREAVAEENKTRAPRSGSVSGDVKLVGSRPSGIVPPDSPLLEQVTATMKRFDKVPVWHTGSTDANIPISLGIPAFTMAIQSGNRSGRSHSLDEWTDVEKTAAVKDFALALAILLTTAEMP